MPGVLESLKIWAQNFDFIDVKPWKSMTNLDTFSFTQRGVEALTLVGTHKMVWFQQLTILKMCWTLTRNLMVCGQWTLDTRWHISCWTVRHAWEKNGCELHRTHTAYCTPRQCLKSGSGSGGSVNNGLPFRIRILTTSDKRFSKKCPLKISTITIFNGIQGPQKYLGRFPDVDPARPVIIWPLGSRSGNVYQD